MANNYDPESYWEKRLKDKFSLVGVGHIGFNEYYNKWLYRKKLHAINSFFNNSFLEDKEVLDIGCGTGFFVQWYLDKGAKVTGIDITDVSIRTLSDRFRKASFLKSDITATQFMSPKKFDIINIWDVIYHQVEDARFAQAIANIAATCKPGCMVLITDKFGSEIDEHVVEHVKFRCMDTYNKIMPKMGFRLLSLHPLYSYLNKYYANLGKFNNYLAPIFYLMDLTCGVAKDNLSLAVWQYRQALK